MIYSSATGTFMSLKFAASHGIPLDSIPTPITLPCIDGTLTTSGAITHTTKVAMNRWGDMEIKHFYVMTLGGYNLVLGMPWQTKYDVRIDFSKYFLTLPSSCSDHVAVAYRHFVPTPAPAPASAPAIALVPSQEFKSIGAPLVLRFSGRNSPPYDPLYPAISH